MFVLLTAIISGHMSLWEFSYSCVVQLSKWLDCRSSYGTNSECVCDAIEVFVVIS
jgi:hypothetical protein